jgi:hypothetical protein
VPQLRRPGPKPRVPPDVGASVLEGLDATSRALRGALDARNALVRNVGRTDFDSTELESSEVRSGSPGPAVDLGAGGYEEPAHTGKVYENRLKKEVSTRLDTISAEVVQDPTLQRSARGVAPGPARRPEGRARAPRRAAAARRRARRRRVAGGGARARVRRRGAPPSLVGRTT